MGKLITSFNNDTEIKRGYWLVRTRDKMRFFISEKVNILALEKVAANVLTDKHFDYWIDYCYGIDVRGAAAWCNLDQTDKFF